MTRGFFWVYTLLLVADYYHWCLLLIVLFLTFGFVGLDYDLMELDDTFAVDTSSVNEHGMTLLVYEDICMVLYCIDGPEAAIMKLREWKLQRFKQRRSLDCYYEGLKGCEIWESAHIQHNKSRLVV
jgi:hypothetical protein